MKLKSSPKSYEFMWVICILGIDIRIEAEKLKKLILFKWEKYLCNSCRLYYWDCKKLKYFLVKINIGGKYDT